MGLPAELKFAIRDHDDGAAAELESARRQSGESRQISVAESTDWIISRSALPITRNPAELGRRRFMAVAAAVGLLATGFAGHAFVSSMATPVRPPNVGNASASGDFSRFDRLMNAGGIAAVQSIYAAGTESDAIRIVAWMGLRRHPNTAAFLVACMSDPRIAVRWGAVREGIRWSPITLKPELPALTATALAETSPAVQNLLSVLITAVQNA